MRNYGCGASARLDTRSGLASSAEPPYIFRSHDICRSPITITISGMRPIQAAIPVSFQAQGRVPPHKGRAEMTMTAKIRKYYLLSGPVASDNWYSNIYKK